MSSDETMDTGCRGICEHESTGLCRSCREQHAGWGATSTHTAGRPVVPRMYRSGRTCPALRTNGTGLPASGPTTGTTHPA